LSRGKKPFDALERLNMHSLAGELGIEPRFRGPEPRALPLDYSPACETNLREGRLSVKAGGGGGACRVVCFLLRVAEEVRTPA
jgi:hypothetical protein